MMRKRGFTIVELVIAIAILGTISLIAVPAFSGIQFNNNVKTDKTLGEQIGQAFVVKSIDDGENSPLLNNQVKYSEQDISKYISKDYTPSALKDSYYVVTQVEVDGKKVIMVGITKDGEPDLTKDDIYDGKKPGWIWSENGQIGDYQLVEPENVEKYTITATSNIEGGVSPSGDCKVNEGADQWFWASNTKAVDKKEYKFVKWVVDGADAGSASRYGFEGVDRDHIIYAVYEEVEDQSKKHQLTVGIEDILTMKTSVTEGEQVSIESSVGEYIVTGIEVKTGNFNFEMPEKNVTIRTNKNGDLKDCKCSGCDITIKGNKDYCEECLGAKCVGTVCSGVCSRHASGWCTEESCCSECCRCVFYCKCPLCNTEVENKGEYCSVCAGLDKCACVGSNENCDECEGCTNVWGCYVCSEHGNFCDEGHCGNCCECDDNIGEESTCCGACSAEDYDEYEENYGTYGCLCSLCEECGRCYYHQATEDCLH